MNERDWREFTIDPEVQKAALRLVLEGGSPDEYLAAINRRAEEIFEAQIRSVCMGKDGSNPPPQES
jgi:hypothetical protein